MLRSSSGFLYLARSDFTGAASLNGSTQSKISAVQSGSAFLYLGYEGTDPKRNFRHQLLKRQLG